MMRRPPPPPITPRTPSPRRGRPGIIVRTSRLVVTMFWVGSLLSALAGTALPAWVGTLGDVLRLPLPVVATAFTVWALARFDAAGPR